MGGKSRRHSISIEGQLGSTNAAKLLVGKDTLFIAAATSALIVRRNARLEATIIELYSQSLMTGGTDQIRIENI